MTIGAIHTSRSFARPVPLRVDVCVTLYTGNVSVLGVLYVFFVNSHGNLLFLNCFNHIFFLMAFETFSVRCPEHQARPSYRMRPVTVSAGRNSAWLLFPEFSFDDFNMHFFDPGMTLCAGCGYVVGRDCRLSIRVRKYEVISVTVVACGCHDQALLEQSLAVNALGVVGKDVPFWNVVNSGYGRSFSVAFSAENGDVHFVCSGLDVGGRKDVVFSVTFIAARGIRSSPLQSLSVDSGKKFLIRLIMADPAVHSFESFGMGELLDFRIHMTGCAVKVIVNGL
ncbi:hypothetical protein ES703_25341 [subsurface metagenome]